MKPKDTEDFIVRTVRFMRRQGRPARHGSVGTCVNITHDGRRCGVGCHFTPRSCMVFRNSDLGDRLVKDGIDRDAVNAVVAAHDCTPREPWVKQSWPERFEAALRFHLGNAGIPWPKLDR